ncbi:MAG: hypothetical protein AB7P23_10475 [Amphiplicatus sp.]
MKWIDLRMPNGHRFKLGQWVTLSPGFGYARKSDALYEIVALLPAERAHVQYRIRSQAEAFERVAAENELMLHSNDTLSDGCRS